MLAKILAQIQAQFSQFSKAQQAQQTQFSTQLEGISNILDRIEMLNNTPSPPPPDPLPQHIIPFTDTAAPSDEQESHEAHGSKHNGDYTDDADDYYPLPVEDSYLNYNAKQDNNNTVDENEVQTTDDPNNLSTTYTCFHTFPSNNKLHRHLEDGHLEDGSVSHTTISNSHTTRTRQNATIPLRVRAKAHHTTPQAVYNKQRVVILPFSHARLPVKVNRQIPGDRDSLFTPEYKQITLYNHAVDANFSFVHAINLSDKPIVIPRKARLGTVSNLEEVNACMAHQDAEIARADQDSLLRIKATHPLGESNPHRAQRKMPNGVTIYGNDTKFADLVNKHPEVWKNPGGFTNIPENEWMRVPLLDDWQTRIKSMKLGRVYFLSSSKRWEDDYRVPRQVARLGSRVRRLVPHGQT